MPVNTDVEILQAALIGLQHMLSQMEEKIQELRQKLGVAPAPVAAGGRTEARKRKLTPEARERIAAAQRKRWAAFRKSQVKRVPILSATKAVRATRPAPAKRVPRGKAVAVKKPAQPLAGAQAEPAAS